MKPGDRPALFLCLWFAVLLGGAVFVKTIFQVSSELPLRMPMVVVLPSDTSAADWQKLEAVAPPGVQIEFVSKETGLGRLKNSLFEGGMPVDTAILADVPGNPVPDILVIRASRPDLYEQISSSVRNIFPTAPVQYDAPALWRWARILTAGKILSTLALILLIILFSMSFVDRLTLRRTGIAQAIGSATLSALIFIVIAGGTLASAGLAAEKHPEIWVRPYAGLAAQFFRHAHLDWIFAAECLTGWIGLSACSAFFSAKSHEKTN